MARGVFCAVLALAVGMVGWGLEDLCAGVAGAVVMGAGIPHADHHFGAVTIGSGVSTIADDEIAVADVQLCSMVAYP